MTRKTTLSMWITCDDGLQRQFQEFLSNDDSFSRVFRDYFTKATFYKELYLHIKHFCWAVTISSERLLYWSTYFFRTLTSSQQLFFQNSYLFGPKHLPTSNFLWLGTYLGKVVFQNSYFLERQICSEYQYTEELLFEAGTSKKHQNSVTDFFHE